MKNSEKASVLAGAHLGLICSHGPIFGYTFGVFLLPLIAEFGWLRGATSLLLSIHGVLLALLMPFAGKLMDAHGVRRFLLPGLLGFGVLVMLLSQLPGNYILWVITIIIMTVFASLGSVIPYAKIITLSFVTHRGLCLGIAISGVGVGAVLFPVASQWIIEEYGWRYAYAALGLAILGIGLPAVFLLLKEPVISSTQSSADDKIMWGDTLAEAMQKKQFYILLATVVLAAIALVAIFVHMVPILVDSGVSAATAAKVVSVAGVTSLISRVIAGYFFDRFYAPYVTACFLSLPMIAGLLLMMADFGPWIFVCGLFLGFGLGAEIDAFAYMSSKYFGRTHFGQIYGIYMAAFSLGAASGPVLTGYSFDYLGSYFWALATAVILLGLAVILLFFMGPYPAQARREIPLS